MRRHAVAALAVVLIFAMTACGAGSSSPKPPLVSIGLGLNGPRGLVASKYAAGLSHASAFAFDSAHRLWVATAAYTDDGQDGVYLVGGAGSTPAKVITGVHTPLGLLWVGSSLYVAAAGGVTAYTGFDGAAFASHTPIVAIADGTGEVNGLARAPDGRISLGISSSCDHCAPAQKYSASIISFEPDGSDVRVDVSHIRAPVGLEYYPGTSDLYVTVDARDDLGAKTPGDALVVARPGDDWGFPGCYGQGGSACRGVPDPFATLDKHAAVSAVAILPTGIGIDTVPIALVAEWATGVVDAVALKQSGRTQPGTVTPFITGIKHPVAVALAPDGSVMAADWTTGVVYRIATST